MCAGPSTLHNEKLSMAEPPLIYLISMKKKLLNLTSFWSTGIWSCRKETSDGRRGNFRLYDMRLQSLKPRNTSRHGTAYRGHCASRTSAAQANSTQFMAVRAAPRRAYRGPGWAAGCTGTCKTLLQPALHSAGSWSRVVQVSGSAAVSCTRCLPWKR